MYLIDSIANNFKVIFISLKFYIFSSRLAEKKYFNCAEKISHL